MKVLFVREKWSDGRPELGLSDGSYLIPTLESSGMGEAMVYYYDAGEFYLKTTDAFHTLAANPPMASEEVVHYADMWRPDLVMFSCLISLGDRNIKRESYVKIRDWGIKVVGLWHEGIAPDVVRWADMYADCVDFNVFLDTKAQFLEHTKFPEKCLGLYDPRDPNTFSDPGLSRDILMGFVGTVHGRLHRIAGIANLWANGVLCEVIGRSGGIFPERTADLLRRSRMGVNFADAGNGNLRHYKGRVAEVLLCGACLFERKNPEIENILEPYIDYVEWESYEDLVDKVRYYAQHEDERRKIAESGKKKAQELLTGKVFWRTVFERAGV